MTGHRTNSKISIQTVKAMVVPREPEGPLGFMANKIYRFSYAWKERKVQFFCACDKDYPKNGPYIICEKDLYLWSSPETHEISWYKK